MNSGTLPYYIKGNYYYITYIGNVRVMVSKRKKSRGYHFALYENDWKVGWCISEFFYTPKDIRRMKLEKINGNEI